jgi:hypothetical protein
MNHRATIRKIESILLQSGRQVPKELQVSSNWAGGVMEAVWAAGPVRQVALKVNGKMDRILWRLALTAAVLAAIAVIFGVSEYMQFESSLVQMAVEEPVEFSAIAMNF